MIGVWTESSPIHSGGRILEYQFAWALASLGEPVVVISDNVPPWAANYPSLPNLQFMSSSKAERLQFSIVITHGLGSQDKRGYTYWQRANSKPKLFAWHFENPEWSGKYHQTYGDGLYGVAWKPVLLDADVILACSEQSRKEALLWIKKDKPSYTVYPAINEFALNNKDTSVVITGEPFALMFGRKSKFPILSEANNELSSLNIVVGTGKELTDIDKFKLLKSAHLVLYPSLFDAFGMTIMESLACGTPVLCYDLPIYKECFMGGIEYARYNDMSDFISKIHNLMSRPKIDLGTIPENIKQKYSLEAMKHVAREVLCCHKI